ncbi:MAG: S1 family peptidase [Acidimicrobiia bacterium]
MRKLVAFIAAIVTLVALANAPVGAVTDGSLDGEGHPYVGMMVAQGAKGGRLWRCSGTLISERIFLTAGHCTEAPAKRVEIWFGSDLRGLPLSTFDGPGDVGGTPLVHPQYDPNAFWLHDLGVVVLDKAYPMAQYGQLPGLDSLDRLKPSASTTFTAVGYGMQKAYPEAAEWKDQADKVRMLATPHLVQINTGFTGDGSLVLSNNANTGGTCFGDSGGPNFVGSSRVIAGVTSFGLNGTCGGTGGVYRVDRADDLDWLAEVAASAGSRRGRR